jgi:hypothetical protein
MTDNVTYVDRKPTLLTGERSEPPKATAFSRIGGKTTEVTGPPEPEYLNPWELQHWRWKQVHENNDEEPQEPETIDVPAHRRIKSGRKPLPDDRPRIEVIHDLPEEDKVCQYGARLSHIGHDTCSKTCLSHLVKKATTRYWSRMSTEMILAVHRSKWG